MKKIKCEICGKEFKSGLNYHGLFGQKACSEDCMEALATKKQKADHASLAQDLYPNKVEKTMNDNMENLYYKTEWPEDCYVIEYEKNPSMYQGFFCGDPIDNSNKLDECLKDVQDCINEHA